MARLFGTDGIRGIAGVELTDTLATNVGKALGIILKEKIDNPKVMIASDTRISRNMLIDAISNGLIDMGVNVTLGGIMPTPAVAFLVPNNFDAGIMITASHNPYEYNGIKIFKADGFKLDDSKEDEIESIINSIDKYKEATVKGIVTTDNSLVDKYVEHLYSAKQYDFSHLKVLLDTSNGSASLTASKIFDKLNCAYTLINDKYDGYNINDNCGSTHLDNIISCIKKDNYDIGFAFDGDADRCLVIDNKGNIIDGDYILAILGLYLKNNNMLKNNTVVGTVMSNMGLIKCLKDNDINYVSTKVGDRYVLKEMLDNDYIIGGEQAGHIIYRKYANTGDGQLTAICILNAMISFGKSINELSKLMTKYPQVLINVKVSNEKKHEYDTNNQLLGYVKEIEDKLNDKGRVLVRPSGTEPLIRVMIEGIDKEEITKYANYLADKVKKILG